MHRLLMTFVLASATCGCTGHGDVAGEVTYGGKKVNRGAVVILASDSLSYTSAIVDGQYRVARVPAGAAKVAVVSRLLSRPYVHGKNKDSAKEPPAPDPKWFPIPEKYADPTTSNLTYIVRSGENKFDIVLTGEVEKK